MCWMQKQWAGKKTWVPLIRAKLLWPNKWVRASPKLQGLWGADGQLWRVPTEGGLRRVKLWPTDRVLRIVSSMHSTDAWHVPSGPHWFKRKWDSVWPGDVYWLPKCKSRDGFVPIVGAFDGGGLGLAWVTLTGPRLRSPTHRRVWYTHVWVSHIIPMTIFKMICDFCHSPSVGS